MSTAVAKVETPFAKPGRFKSALLGWLGIPIHLTDGNFWAMWFGQQSVSGELVTETTALRLSAVWGCVRLIAGAIATLPLNLYEKKGTGRRLATDHPLFPLLKMQPNADMTAVQFWEAFIVSMLLPGNGFAQKMRRGDGALTALELLLPARTTVKRQPDGSLLYRTIDFQGKSHDLAEGEIFHVPGFTLDGVFGLSSIQYGANVLGNAMSAERASGTLFANGMRIQGVFEFDHVVKENQRDQFKKSLDAYKGAINAGGTPLLEAGIHYKSITMNAEDAELLGSRGYSVEEICRWFQVPPFMVGHGEKANGWPSSIEQQMIAFITFTLRTWLKRIEQGISKSLLRPEERARYYAEFALEGLLRGDSSARKEWYNTLIRAGVMSRNEAREKENMEPAEGGEVLTAESNLVPLASYVKDPDEPAGDLQANSLAAGQVTSLQAILSAGAKGELPLKTVAAMIKASFPLLSDAQIAAMVKPLEDFEAPPAPTPPAPGADDPPPEDPADDEGGDA